MIIRLTESLAKKIREAPSECVPREEHPYTDWTAHLFTVQKTQYILVANTASLYSFVIYGRGICHFNDFITQTLSHMRDFLTAEGQGFIFQRLIAPSARSVVLSKTGDRHLLGSMIGLIAQAKYFLGPSELSPRDASLLLNQTPLSYLNQRCPKTAFGDLRVDLELKPGDENWPPLPE